MGTILDAKLLDIECEKGDFMISQGVKHGTKSTKSFKNLGFGVGGESIPARIEILAEVTTKDGAVNSHVFSVRQSLRPHFSRFTQKILKKIKGTAPKKFQVEVRQNNSGNYYFALLEDFAQQWADRVNKIK